jgi:hypothetical protein
MLKSSSTNGDSGKQLSLTLRREDTWSLFNASLNLQGCLIASHVPWVMYSYCTVVHFSSFLVS